MTTEPPAPESPRSPQRGVPSPVAGGSRQEERSMKMETIFEVLDILRAVEQLNRDHDIEPGALGTLRAKAFCAKSSIEAQLADIEVSADR